MLLDQKRELQVRQLSVFLIFICGPLQVYDRQCWEIDARIKKNKLIAFQKYNNMLVHSGFVDIVYAVSSKRVKQITL